MVLAGTYTLVNNENFLEHLIASGVPPETAKKADEHKSTLEVSLNGNTVTLNSASGKTDFPLGQEVDEHIPNNQVLKSTASLNGEVLTVVSKSEKGNFTRIYDFSGDGAVVTMKSDDLKVPVAKRFYTRS